MAPEKEMTSGTQAEPATLISKTIRNSLNHSPEQLKLHCKSTRGSTGALRGGPRFRDLSPLRWGHVRTSKGAGLTAEGTNSGTPADSRRTLAPHSTQDSLTQAAAVPGATLLDSYLEATKSIMTNEI